MYDTFFYYNHTSKYDNKDLLVVAVGLASPHWFIAAMVTVTLPIGSSLTVTVVLVHWPHAVVISCTPDVEDTLMS